MSNKNHSKGNFGKSFDKSKDNKENSRDGSRGNPIKGSHQRRADESTINGESSKIKVIKYNFSYLKKLRQT